MYIGVIIGLYGIPDSVSETFYLLPKKFNWLFTFFCWAVSAIVVPWLNISSENYQFLVFLSVGGLCFVGTAAQFKEDFVKKVHFGAAAVCLICSQLWIFLATELWWVSLICLAITIGILIFNKFKNDTFWIEMWAFISLFIVLLMIYI